MARITLPVLYSTESAAIPVIADTNVYVSSFSYLQRFVTHMGPGQGAVADLMIGLEVCIVVPQVGHVSPRSVPAPMHLHQQCTTCARRGICCRDALTHHIMRGLRSANRVTCFACCVEVVLRELDLLKMPGRLRRQDELAAVQHAARTLVDAQKKGYGHFKFQSPDDYEKVGKLAMLPCRRLCCT